VFVKEVQGEFELCLVKKYRREFEVFLVKKYKWEFLSGFDKELRRNLCVFCKEVGRGI
jgi:hypothetical protein